MLAPPPPLISTRLHAGPLSVPTIVILMPSVLASSIARSSLVHPVPRLLVHLEPTAPSPLDATLVVLARREPKGNVASRGSIADLRGIGNRVFQDPERKAEGIGILLRLLFTTPSDLQLATDLIQALATLLTSGTQGERCTCLEWKQ